MGRKQKIVSIEIGYATIRICEMEQGDKPKIYHFLELETPKLAVNDGYIEQDKLEEVRKVIVSALKKNKIRTKKAIFTLFSSKIITREVVLPDMKEKQLRQVIEENINDYFPIELEDFRVTHTRIDSFLDVDNSEKVKLLVIAAEKKLVAQYEKLAELCRFTLVDVDYVGNSVYQFLKKEPRTDAQMFVKVETENTLIMVMEGDRLVLQRSLNYGMKIDEENLWDMEATIRPILGTITRILHYYSGQSYKHLETVTVLGSGAMYIDLFNDAGEDGIVTYKALTVSDERLTVKNPELKEKIPDYIACIGAGIASINLINYKPSIRRVNYIRASALMIILYVFVNLSLILMAYLPYLDAEEKTRELKKLEKQYEEAERIYDRYTKTQEFYDLYLEGHDYTKHANDGLIDFLEELEKKLPEDATVLSLHSDDENIILQMEVSTKEEAAGTIEALRHFDSVMDVEVYAVSDTPSGEEDELHLVSFTIKCTYYPVHQDLKDKEE